MAHNTMYKHLARHITTARQESALKTTDPAGVNKILDDLCWDYADEIADRQPGSFDKVRFLYESGTTDAEGNRL